VARDRGQSRDVAFYLFIVEAMGGGANMVRCGGGRPTLTPTTGHSQGAVWLLR